MQELAAQHLILSYSAVTRLLLQLVTLVFSTPEVTAVLSVVSPLPRNGPRPAGLLLSKGQRIVLVAHGKNMVEGG